MWINLCKLIQTVLTICAHVWQLMCQNYLCCEKILSQDLSHPGKEYVKLVNLSLQLQTHWDSVWPILPQSKWPVNKAECKQTHTNAYVSDTGFPTKLRLARLLRPLSLHTGATPCNTLLFEPTSAPPNNSHLFIAASHSLYTQSLVGGFNPSEKY